MNNFIKTKLSNDKSKPKKRKVSYYIVLFLLVFFVIGSTLGTIGFARTFALSEKPDFTNLVWEPIVNSTTDLENSWIRVPKAENSLDFVDFNIQVRNADINNSEENFSVCFVLDTGDFFELSSDYVYAGSDYLYFYLDLEYINSQCLMLDDRFVPYVHIHTFYVTSTTTPVPTLYHTKPFNDGQGLLGTIVGTLTGGITSLGSGIGSGLSTLANSIFINSQGTLSVFGILIVVFAGLSLAISLSRLLVSWLGSLGGKSV